MNNVIKQLGVDGGSSACCWFYISCNLKIQNKNKALIYFAAYRYIYTFINKASFRCIYCDFKVYYGLEVWILVTHVFINSLRVIVLFFLPLYIIKICCFLGILFENSSVLIHPAIISLCYSNHLYCFHSILLVCDFIYLYIDLLWTSKLFSFSLSSLGFAESKKEC